MPYKLRSTHKFIKILLMIFIVLVVYWGHAVLYPQSLPDNRPYTLTVSKGSSLHAVANQLAEAKLLNRPRLFVWVTWLLGKETKVVAGMYIINRPMSLLDLVNRLTNGHPDEISITFNDGMTFKQIRSYLDSESQITHTTRNMTESQIRAALKVSEPSMEGLLFPDTYYVTPQSKRFRSHA